MANELFDRITGDLQQQGYSIQRGALPEELAAGLAIQFAEQAHGFVAAGLGRGQNFRQQENVRRDTVLWIHGDNPAEQAWLTWCERLREQLNRELFLGLLSFESHFSHYKPGDFYKRHLDAFRNDTQPINNKPRRKLSLTTYFNNDWQKNDGGELLIYPSVSSNDVIAEVAPEHGTVCLFLSDEFPHEVLPANRNRYSIAGWFRGR